jgi:hypothetical protein
MRMAGGWNADAWNGLGLTDSECGRVQLCGASAGFGEARLEWKLGLLLQKLTDMPLGGRVGTVQRVAFRNMTP